MRQGQKWFYEQDKCWANPEIENDNHYAEQAIGKKFQTERGTLAKDISGWSFLEILA